MNFRVQSKFTPADRSRLEAALVPAIVAAVTGGCASMVVQAQAIVPVDTGALRDSIHTVDVVWDGGTRVIGHVVAAQPYAAYVEFGTGVRGAASSGAGPYPYNPKWPGQVAQPYMRPALDSSRPQIVEAFATVGFRGVRLAV